MGRRDDANLARELAAQPVPMSMIAYRRRRGSPRVVGQQLGLGQGQVVGTGLRIDGGAALPGRRDLRRSFGKTDVGKVRPSACLESELKDSAHSLRLRGWTPPLEEGLQVIAALRVEAAPSLIEDPLVLGVYQGDGVQRFDPTQQLALIVRIQERLQCRAAVAGKELEPGSARRPKLLNGIEPAGIYAGIQREVDAGSALAQFHLVSKDLSIEHLGPRQWVIDDGGDPAGRRRGRHVTKIGWAQ